MRSRRCSASGQDETRIGLKTITGKVITACGVKPIGLYQWLFEYLWLYGLVEPKTGAGKGGISQ